MTTTAQKNRLHNPSLLVVDDDALVLATLATGFRDEGYTVHEASSGEEAIAIAKEHDIDLAILDIRMPGLSGIETASILYKTNAIPFLFLSAFNDAATVSMAVSEGALGYLIKPIDVDHMLPTVQTALNRSAEIKLLKTTKNNLANALNLERDISIAIGIIMANSNHHAADAEKAMRSYARSNRLKMHDVARLVIDASDKLKSLINQIITNTN